MAFTYVQGSTATRDRVRLEIGDTVVEKALFQDEELDDIIVQESSVLASSARACEILATRFAREFNFTADGTRFEKKTISEAYAVMGRNLRIRVSGSEVTTIRPQDAYSNDINIETATVGNVDFDRGVFDR